MDEGKKGKSARDNKSSFESITHHDIQSLIERDSIRRMLRWHHNRRCILCKEKNQIPGVEEKGEHIDDDAENTTQMVSKRNRCNLDMETMSKFVAEKYNSQFGTCVSCKLPLELYKDLSSATNFRFRTTDSHNCPIPSNISHLICVPCENLLIAVNHVTDDFTASRNLLFSDGTVKNVKHIPYLQSSTSLQSHRGISKTILKDIWNAQGGFSAYYIPRELQDLLPLTQQERIKSYTAVEVASQTQNIKEDKKDQKTAKTLRDKLISKQRWSNPNFLFFLVPLQGKGKGSLFQAKLHPESTADKSQPFSFSTHTYVSSILLRMQGSLHFRAFLTWAIKALKQLPQDHSLIKKRFPTKVEKPVEVSPAASDQELIEIIKLHAIERKAVAEISAKASERKNSRGYVTTLKNAEQAMYLLHKVGTPSVFLPNENINVTLKLPVKGRRRQITEDTIAMHMPSLLKTIFPSLSSKEITEGSILLTQKLFSEEVLGRDPPDWSLSWSNPRKRKISE